MYTYTLRHTHPLVFHNCPQAPFKLGLKLSRARVQKTRRAASTCEANWDKCFHYGGTLSGRAHKPP